MSSSLKQSGIPAGNSTGRSLGTSMSAAFALIEKCCVDMLAHDGFGELRVETRILKRGQKEIIVHFGKQYRFVVDQT